MATDRQRKERDLSELLKKAVVKERRILSFSVVFTTITVALGFAWIAYAANKVTKLEEKEAALQTQIAARERELLSVEADLTRLKTSLEQSRRPTESELKSALQVLSNVQQRVKTAIEVPTPEVTETPLSTPTPAVAVPNLKGLGAEQAWKLVQEAGLEPIKIDQEGRGEPGTVLYQDPLPGRRIPPNAKVNLYIIPAFATIPNVKGMARADAERLITQARLGVNVVQQEGRGTPGTILYQDPVSGKSVKVGTVITVYVVKEQ